MDGKLRALLGAHRVTLKKAYGQNFLTDDALLLDIVKKAGVTDNDTVLEIGCGAGALTRALAKTAKRVVGYEIDVTLKPVLSETLSGLKNVEIVFKDIMRENLCALEEKLGGKYILVANLPYYITTPIVMQFIEKAKNLKGMAIMVQEEVALRFCAKPGTSDYGAITVGINLRGNAEIIKRVGREMFTPVPNVDSAVVKIDIVDGKFDGVDFDSVRNAVRAGFSSRRKMLVNNLMNFYKLPRNVAESVMTDAGVPLDCRGEKLSAEDYVRLSESISKYGK